MSPQALARSRRDAIRRRTRRIRRSVAAFAVAIFMVAFTTVYVQLASGHDPALTAAAKKSTATRSAAASATVSSGNSSDASSSGESSSGSSGVSSESVSAVTTSQS